MSTSTPQLTPQQQSGAQVEKEVEAAFARVAASGPQPRLRTIAGTCRFDIALVGTWCVTLKDGMVTVTKGAKDTPATAVIASDAADFLRVVRREGRMNFMTAVLQELMTITGDVPFAYTALGSFMLKPEDARPR